MPRSPESTINRIVSGRGKSDAMSNKAASAIITSTDSYSEKVTYNGAAGGSSTPVTHPYLGPNSWIRIMPESLTTAIIGSRAEDGEPYIQAYLRDPSQNTNKELPVVNATRDEKFYYRPLNEGEIDLSSSGIANIFLSKTGNLELRGGPVSVVLNSDRLETQMLSPTHMRGVHGYKRQDIVNQERFGVVQRPNSKSSDLVTDDTIWDVIKVAPAGGLVGDAVAAATGNMEWAQEYLRVLKNKKGILLVDHREGNVIGDDGEVVNSDATGNPLRCQIRYGTTLKTETVFDVDEDGNIAVSLPVTSTKGIIGQVPMASIDLTIGKDFAVKVLRSIVLDVLSSLDITGPVCNINTLAVNIVKGADQHMVRGEDLVQWLVAHQHPTAMGPSGAPLTGATLPTILSATGMIK
jgi:hypothetical protein